MRVLFTVIPERTMFLSMAPLAWALRTAGHEVRVASQPSFADVITQAGLTAVPVGRHSDLWRVARLTPEVLEEVRAGLPAPYDAAEDAANATWDRMTAGYATMVEDAYKPENFPMLAGLVDFARHWRPDLVIWEPFTYAGPIAAKACGAAHARLLWGIDVFGVAREHYLRLKSEQPPENRADPLADWLASYGRRYGFDFTEDMTTGHFTIDQFPASLQLEAALHYVRMQYVPYGGPAVVPRWLWATPQRPRVALTMGLTAVDSFAGYPVSMQGILDALADLDIELVATIAEAEQKKLTRVPANARVVTYVPWHALAPTCAAIIHHAGSGTLATTALHAVPQLAVPYHFDEPIFARQLADHGAGLQIQLSALTGPTVRESVLRLLNEPGFRHRATDLRDEIRALPAPNDIVAQLEELAVKHRAADR